MYSLSHLLHELFEHAPPEKPQSERTIIRTSGQFLIIKVLLIDDAYSSALQLHEIKLVLERKEIY